MGEEPEASFAERGRDLLDRAWKRVLLEEETPDRDSVEWRLINSRYVAIRYCLPTQVLGKLLDSSLNILSLQKGMGGEVGTWDPRSFCTKTIVPWVLENQAVLGTSPDPYVGKPLRRPFLEPSPTNVKGGEDWKDLHNYLHKIEESDDHEFALTCFLKILRCIKSKLSDLTFEYPVPRRISLEQTIGIIDAFLSETSGGDRGLSLSAALLETIGDAFNIFGDVRRETINAADRATGQVSDIECYCPEGELRLAVEVKERAITLADVNQSIRKARKASLTEFLFSAPGTRSEDREEIETLFEKSWALGTNLYQISIRDMARATLCLTGEAGRIDFLKRVGEQLDRYNTQPINRQRWKELMEEI